MDAITLPLPAYTPDEARRVREQYSLASAFIMLPWGHPLNKKGHVYYLHWLQALRYEETSVTSFARAGFLPESVIGRVQFNPRNCKNLNLFQFAGLTLHELFHLIFQHPFAPELKGLNNPLGIRLQEVFPHASREWLTGMLRRIVKYCMDVSINQTAISEGYELPAGAGLITDDPTRVIGPCLPETLAAEFGILQPGPSENYFYYALWAIEALALKKDEAQKRDDDAPPSGGGDTPDLKSPDQQVQELAEQIFGDDASEEAETWEAMSGLSREEQEIIKQLLATVAERVEQSAGLLGLPGQVAGAHKELVALKRCEPTFGRELHWLVGRCGTPNIVIKRNRLGKPRGAGDYGSPGLATYYDQLSIGWVVDTSGSVPNPVYGAMLGAALYIQRIHNCAIYILETDYGPANKPWLLSAAGIKEFYERNGYGGTNMRKGLEYFLDPKCPYPVGALVCSTDGGLGMDSYMAPSEVHLPLLWALTERVTLFGGKVPAGKVSFFDPTRIR